MTVKSTLRSARRACAATGNEYFVDVLCLQERGVGHHRVPLVPSDRLQFGRPLAHQAHQDLPFIVSGAFGRAAGLSARPDDLALELLCGFEIDAAGWRT